MMNKEAYERMELEIIRFQTADVICTSEKPQYEDDETQLIK